MTQYLPMILLGVLLNAAAQLALKAGIPPDAAQGMSAIVFAGSSQFIGTQLMAYQRRTGATLLLASHNMPEVERMCDAVLMMRAGRIVDTGSPAELIARYGRTTMEEVFLDVARSRDRAVEVGPDEILLGRE